MTRTRLIVSALVARLVLLTYGVESRAADPESINRSELPVLVTETPGMVRLQVLLPEDVPPGSVEVRLAGRKVVVLARGIDGRQLRSRSLRLADAPVARAVRRRTTSPTDHSPSRCRRRVVAAHEAEDVDLCAAERRTRQFFGGYVDLEPARSTIQRATRGASGVGERPRRAARSC